MQAVSFHSSWARRMGVNILAANIHLPFLEAGGGGKTRDIRGTGIYQGASGRVAYYDDSTSGGMLLVANLTVKPPKPVNNTIAFLRENSENITPGNVECGRFTGKLQKDPYDMTRLCKTRGQAVLKSGNTHCHVSYRFHAVSTAAHHTYTLAVFDGLHTSAKNSYIQVCAVVVYSPEGICGNDNANMITEIEHLEITG